MAFDLDQAVAKKVEEHLANIEETTAWPVLIMLCGLPATGKSYLARRLVEQMPFVIVETDFVRQTLFAPPTYSAQESGQVHRVCHALMEKLLQCGARVVFDATNLLSFTVRKSIAWPGLCQPSWSSFRRLLLRQWCESVWRDAGSPVTQVTSPMPTGRFTSGWRLPNSPSAIPI
jgi:hypothetical protein